MSTFARAGGAGGAWGGTGGGWWHRPPPRGGAALDLDADSLTSLDSLVSWLVGSDVGAAAGTGDRQLAGAAHVLLTLEGSLDSLAFDARASGERLKWRGWAAPAGRARLAW